MRPYRMLPAILMLALALFACSKKEEPKPEGEEGGGIGPKAGNKSLAMDCFCVDTNRSGFCWIIPNDIAQNLPGDYSGLDSTNQQMFDLFSWQSFIALNWPANPDGTPDTTSSISNTTSPRVWDFYTDPIDLFGLPASKVPQVSGLPKGMKLLRMMAKNAHIGSATGDDMSEFLQATGQPLIDRNLNFVLYEIKLNPVETAYIVNNGLTTTQGQAAFQGTVDFPEGTLVPDSVGALEIKAAWRIMRPDLGDDTTRYYTRWAVISIPPVNVVNNQPLIDTVLVGMVGMHINHKTSNGKGWVWSTFEHIDNAPSMPYGANPLLDDSVRYSFFNPAGLFTGAINTPAATFTADSGIYKWSPQQPYAALYASKGGIGSQIVRGFPIFYETQLVTSVWRQKLQGTVWANYELIGAQWMATVFVPPTDSLPGRVDTTNAPAFLANTALESFIPGNSSCIGCHSFATMTNGAFADFTFVLGLAKQGLLNSAHAPQHLPHPTRPMPGMPAGAPGAVPGAAPGGAAEKGPDTARPTIR